MKIAAIIAEYNPFHKGHLEHLKQAKKITSADYVIALISGNFVQRGEPAIVDKWQRAEMAVEAGLDLVLELPTFYATASAENFALGAVYLLNQIGVDYLAFGAENADINILKKVATEMQRGDYQARLKSIIKSGASYHRAASEALRLDSDNFTFAPNNILAIEYLKALSKLNSKIEPVAIQRRGDDYNSQSVTSSFASATAIRKTVLRRTVDWQLVESLLPLKQYQILYNSVYYAQLNDYKQIFNAAAIALGKEGIAEIRGVGEGLENRIYDNLSKVMSLDDLVESVSTKRYPQTRIKRIIINLLLGIKKEQAVDLALLDYARILAYRAESSVLLKKIKKDDNVFLINNVARDLKKYQKKNALIDLDIKATGVYACIAADVELRADYRRRAFRQIDK